MKKVLILGGGPCGCAVAWELARLGIPCVIVEKENELGGLCRTVERNGFRFDYGGHRFISSNVELVNRMKGLLGDDFLLAERISYIVFMGQMFGYPLQLEELVKKLPLSFGIKSVASFGWERIIKKFGAQREIVSLEDWIRSRFGDYIYRIFFKPYSERLWGKPPSEVSGDWAGQRISFPGLGDVILRLVGLKKKGVRTYAKSFLYPKYGIGQIFKRLGDELKRLGVDVRLNSTVERVHLADDRIVSVDVKTGDNLESVEADYIVSTIPLDIFIRSFAPENSELKNLAGRLQFRSLRFLDVMLDAEKLGPATWYYVAGAGYKTTRVQEPKKRSQYMAPDGKTSVMLEIACWEGDEIWNMDEKKLFELGMEELERIGFKVSGKVLGYFTKYAKNAYPVYPLDYKSLTKSVFSRLDGIENLVCLGRQGTFRYLFMDTVMETGIAAARMIAKGEVNKPALRSFRSESELIEVKSIVES